MTSTLTYKKESPIIGLTGLGGGVATFLTSGVGAAEAVYVDDVYAPFYFKGAGSDKTVKNYIDLAGEGGLIVFKRNDNDLKKWRVTDTVRDSDADKYLDFRSDANQTDESGFITSLNSDGLTLTNAEETNKDGEEHASWCFRKAPGFLDIVTYTGNGAARTISHNLKSVPKMIWVKSIDDTPQDWTVYHVDHGKGKYSRLDYNTLHTSANIWDDTVPTDSVVHIGDSAKVNQGGGDYVMYLWGDDAVFGEDGDQQICKFGTYTGTGSAGLDVDLGWEPQFLMIKGITWDSADAVWHWIDSQSQGLVSNHTTQNTGIWKLSSYEKWHESPFIRLHKNNTGFRVTSTSEGTNKSGQTFAYFAIRRPDGYVGRPPEDGSKMFYAESWEGNGAALKLRMDDATDLLNPDWVWIKKTSATESWSSSFRMHGNGWQEAFDTADTDTEIDSHVANDGWARSHGVVLGGHARVNANGSDYLGYLWKRTPGVLDVINYYGDDTSNRAIPHKLGVKPDMIWMKAAESTNYYTVFAPDAGWTPGANAESMVIYDSAAKTGYFAGQNISAPTATNIYMGSSQGTGAYGNQVNTDYHAVLWAKKDGVLNMGSYVGNGFGGGNTPTAVTVTCGFQPRFIMVKNQNANTGWYVFDYHTGLTNSNKKYLKLDVNYGYATSDNNWLYVTSTGFVVTNLADNDINEYSSSPTFNYFWMAIA